MKKKQICDFLGWCFHHALLQQLLLMKALEQELFIVMKPYKLTFCVLSYFARLSTCNGTSLYSGGNLTFTGRLE